MEVIPAVVPVVVVEVVPVIVPVVVVEIILAVIPVVVVEVIPVIVPVVVVEVVLDIIPVIVVEIIAAVIVSAVPLGLGHLAGDGVHFILVLDAVQHELQLILAVRQVVLPLDKLQVIPL